MPSPDPLATIQQLDPEALRLAEAQSETDTSRRIATLLVDLDGLTPEGAGLLDRLYWEDPRLDREGRILAIAETAVSALRARERRIAELERVESRRIDRIRDLEARLAELAREGGERCTRCDEIEAENDSNIGRAPWDQVNPDDCEEPDCFGGYVLEGLR